MTIKLTRITRRYANTTSLAEAKARTTQRLKDELAEDRISRALVEEYNNRQRERRSTPYYIEH